MKVRNDVAYFSYFLFKIVEHVHNGKSCRGFTDLD